MAKLYNSVGSLLRGQSLVVLAPELTVREAARILRSNGIGAAPVLVGERLVGMFSERDVLNRVVAEDRDPDATRVGDVMTPDPCTIGTETTLVQAFEIMSERKFRHLPVVDQNGKVLAVMSFRDVPTDYRMMHLQWQSWTRSRQGASARA